MLDTLAQLVAGVPLTEAQSEAAFETVLRGEADAAQIASLLSLIQRRGATVDEIVGAARVMRRHVARVPTDSLAPGTRVVDTCGTGGAAKTFNVSTVAAIIAAAAGRSRGVAVAKHGNRSRTGRGSAETLAALGVNIETDIHAQAACLAQVGVCFSFAVRHHPAMKHAAPVRAALGFPTIFNLLGPLTNPAGATRQLLGVYSPTLVEPMALALVRLGADRAMVVHARDGLDELSTTGPTTVADVSPGAVSRYEFDAADLGLPRVALDDLRAPDLAAAADLARSILINSCAGPARAARDIALLNAAATLVVADAASGLAEGLALAREAVRAGAAADTLDALVRVSNG